MTNFWQWLIVVGGALIFLGNASYAIIKIFSYIKHGKKNADSYFEKKVQKIANSIIKEEMQIALLSREQEFKVMREFISSEIKPIHESIKKIEILNHNLHSATITDLKIKLRRMYHEVFETNGALTAWQKSDWDKWFADYTHLGGNGDVKAMDDHIQKIHLEVIIEKQKEKIKKKDEQK